MKLITKKDKKSFDKIKKYLKCHFSSFKISLYASVISFLLYVLYEFQTVDFSSPESIITKALILQIVIRSGMKIFIEYLEEQKSKRKR